MKYLWILAVFLFLTAATDKDGSNGPLAFFDGSLPSAKELAGAEGKMLLLDFYASWCPPCRIMEETCFKNRETLSYIESNFVALKVNVDDLDGRVIKEKYNVTRLPTYIVLSSAGEEVDRIEGSMPADQFLSFLKRTDNPAFREKIPLQRPALIPSDSQDNVQANHSPPAQPLESATPENDGHFIVQVGVYSNRTRARELADRIHEQMGIPMEVEVIELDGKSSFRVSAGDFEDRGLAAFTSKKLAGAGWDNFIRERK